MRDMARSGEGILLRASHMTPDDAVKRQRVKGKSPKLGLTNDKDLMIELPRNTCLTTVD